MARLRPLLPAVLIAVCLGACALAPSAIALAAHRTHARSAHARVCHNTALLPTGHDLRLIRAATLCLINRERTAHGERPLRANHRLTRAAQAHSHNMAARDYFEHDGAGGPGGGTPLTRLRASGYISSARVGFEVGENIAWATS